MTQPLEPWVVETARWPLAFAQVREDPLLDLKVVHQIGSGAHVIMVASGGCTAAHLVGKGNVQSLHLVDPNPAQLALTRLKLHLLRVAQTEERLALLGHQPWVGPVQSRARRLAKALDQLDLPMDALGPFDQVAELGPDHAGRYERLFAELRCRLQPHRPQLDSLLEMSEPAAQSALVAPERPLGRALDEALDEVMALPNLIALFGGGATRNRVMPFARHFAQQTRHAFSVFPAHRNPFLWQMYRGVYPPNTPADWFSAAAPAVWPEIIWSNALMTDALAETRQPVDFVHLSNILDWLSPEEARATLELAARALKPGGLVLIRQLNSTLEIPKSGPAFDWQMEQARMLHAADRSFFYRDLNLGRKR
ncbi:MAG: BtaA family protein [Gemmataceae bacterium]|nr:BtaA family protein [Gemmataceae bacterium]